MCEMTCLLTFEERCLASENGIRVKVEFKCCQCGRVAFVKIMEDQEDK